jgi:acylphosphatase
MAPSTFHLIIHGRVQGVGYRAWMVARARALGVNGWVRNRTDGSVEAVISGHTDSIEHMVAACHEGPLAARVTQVDVSDEAEGVAEGFRSKATV